MTTISGYDLSATETVAFNELKKSITRDFDPKEVDDGRIYRFLKAREFNVQQAELMLRDNIKWRKREKIDTILEDYKPPEVLEKFFPFYILGLSLDGRPLLMFELGNTDFKGLLKSVKLEEIVKYTIFQLELAEKYLREQSKKRGKPLETWISIVDFQESTFLQITNKSCVDILKDVTSSYESNYPERLEKQFTINASRYFSIVFNFMKSVLSPVTTAKLRPFGKDGWKEELAKLMDHEELPAYWGGKKTDPDGNPKCNKVFHHGGPVPKSYYFKSAERRLKNKSGVVKYTLKRNEMANIPVDVKIAGSLLEWDFETENHDIGFGLSYRLDEGSNEKQKVLIPVERCATEMEYKTSSHLCQNIGTYIFTFDNSFSWFRQKEIFSRISITEPGGKKTIASE